GACGGPAERGGCRGGGAVGVERARHLQLLQPGEDQLGPQRRQRLVRHLGRRHVVRLALQVRLDGLLRPRRADRPGVLRQVPPGDEHGDRRADHGEDRRPVQQRRAGPGLRHGVQQDRHRRAGGRPGPPHRQLPVR
uniref:Uncharacterized protein n=1 Tax=Triticum aestivum TaxID=4565 RepID=A0A3B5Z292_WHEAT